MSPCPPTDLRPWPSFLFNSCFSLYWWCVCYVPTYLVKRRKTTTDDRQTSVWRSETRRWILLTYARQFLLWAYFTYLLWCLLSLLTSRVMARFHQKVPVLHVRLVVMAGNCFWCILEEMFLVVWRVYNGRLCGRSFSWTSGEFVAVRRVGVLLLVRFAKPNLCVWGGHI